MQSDKEVLAPHYDNYDVFLYQAEGQRKWLLTTQDCNPANYLNDVSLRIMQQFKIEEEYLLEPGDMLYLPPHIGHHGISQSDHCMTYSFGYRSYQGPELWNSFGDYLSDQDLVPLLYRDPDWTHNQSPSRIPPTAWLQAKQLMQAMLNDDTQLKTWFGNFITRLDQQTEQNLIFPLAENELPGIPAFIKKLTSTAGLTRDLSCRFAFYEDKLQLFINGSESAIDRVTPELVKLVANNRLIATENLLPLLNREENKCFVYELWALQWLVFKESL